MDLVEAMKRVGMDRALATEFSHEPERVLKSLGVDTSKVRIRRDPEQEIPINICVSVGAIVCASAGMDIGSEAAAAKA